MDIRVESVLEKKSKPIHKTKPNTITLNKEKMLQAGIPVKINCKKMILQAFHPFPWHITVGYSTL